MTSNNIKTHQFKIKLLNKENEYLSAFFKGYEKWVKSVHFYFYFISTKDLYKNKVLINKNNNIYNCVYYIYLKRVFESVVVLQLVVKVDIEF